MLQRSLTKLKLPTPKATDLQKRKCGLLAAIDNIWSPHYNQSTPSTSPLLNDEYPLRSATGTMIHRGPDGRHTARGNILSNQGHTNPGDEHGVGPKWVMGHQRLAIVDPDSHAADMPFLLEFGGERYRLVANGEIYNHNSVYDELVTNHGWKYDKISKSDCETIAHACAALGPEEAVKKLDGMFAFVLFKEGDSENAPVAFAARDPVGIKPLYYGETGDGAVAFASELKALVGHVQAGSVRQLPPGHYWTPEGGEVRYHWPEWNFNVRTYILFFVFLSCFMSNALLELSVFAILTRRELCRGDHSLHSTRVIGTCVSQCLNHH